MLSTVSHVRNDEVHIKGYIKQNYLNAKRLIHITGLPIQGWKIKRIESAHDPCPVKLSQKEKDKVLATSKAQSIVSSRNSSRRSSKRGSFDDAEMKDVLGNLKDKLATKDSATGTESLMVGTDGCNPETARDCGKIENDPGMFAQEQTWPTEDEMKKAAKQRKGSMEESDNTIPTSTEGIKDMSSIKGLGE